MSGLVSRFDPWSAGLVPAPAPDPTAEGTYASLPFVPALQACTACPCRLEARQVVLGTGPVVSPVLVIGQNPGEEEDVAGVPFIGQGGDELDRWLKVLGIARPKILITNAVHCHTTGNRLPKTSELKTCTNLWLAQELAALTALQLLFPVGKSAVSAVLGKSAPPMTPLAAHHYRIQVGGRELHVFPLPHPAFLLRARHMALQMQTVLTHVRLTLEQELPDVLAAVKVVTRCRS